MALKYECVNVRKNAFTAANGDQISGLDAFFASDIDTRKVFLSDELLKRVKAPMVGCEYYLFYSQFGKVSDLVQVPNRPASPNAAPVPFK